MMVHLVATISMFINLSNNFVLLFIFDRYQWIAYQEVSDGKFYLDAFVRRAKNPMVQGKPQVAVIMGSASDSEVMKGCVELLRELELRHEVKVLSAHRTPDLTRAYAVSAADRGIEVIIAGAGWAAHLAGAIAAHTTLPVIGVPIDSSPFKGLDHEKSNRR